jgi:Ca2+-binding RTX toxin-like protein
LLNGGSGADLLDGEGGNDTAQGGGGSDTFVFNAGYGHLEITENYTSGQQPVLQLGAGITAASLHVTTDGTNLYVTDGVSGDQITLDKMWSNASADGVSQVNFADGSSITAAQLIQMEMTGTTGNDTITGTSGADLIDGKGGTDSVTGGGGNDTFIFNSGHGSLTINEAYKSSQAPVLKLGAGLTASALHATKNGNNLVLTDGVSGDQITLINMWSTATDGVASLQLSDGTTLTRSQIIALEMTGTTGNDTITGTSGADLIDGKGGTDSVTGGGGNDTFIFNSGYGGLTINEAYTSGQTPVLELGAGITASALHAVKSGNNLVLTDGVSGDQITLINMWSTSTDGVGSLQLSGGTTLTRNQVIALEMTGTTGNDTITGTSGADLIDGKGGTDSVTGGGGSDTFVFNSGYGKLTINETYTSGQAPVLELGAGITSSTLHVAQSGNNMVLTDGVSGDQITLIGMWSTSTDGVATVQFSDGTTLSRSQLLSKGQVVKETQAVSSASGTNNVDSSMASMTSTDFADSPSAASSANKNLGQVMRVDAVATAPLDPIVTSQLNSLIQSMASFTGIGHGSGGQFENLIPPAATLDTVLHSAS